MGLFLFWQNVCGFHEKHRIVKIGSAELGGDDMLKAGDQAPDFSLPGNDGKTYSLSDFRDKFLVLYFYPKDMTSGCTLQAQGYSQLYSEFEKKEACVVGVSPDSLVRHEKFCQKEHIPFLLLSDKDSLVAKAYSAFGKKKLYGHEYEGVIRSTFLIRNGVVVHAEYNVKPKNDPSNFLGRI